MTEYCTVDELKSELGIRGDDTVDDALLALSVKAASGQIDGYCGVTFGTDSTVRVFFAEGRTLELSPVIEDPDGLVLKVDDDMDGVFETTLTVATDFYLAPVNAAADGVPYSEIVLYGRTFPCGERPSAQVTATFGYTSVPDDVRKACLIQAAQLFKSKDAVFGAVALGESSSMFIRAALNPTAKALLARYQVVPVG